MAEFASSSSLSADGARLAQRIPNASAFFLQNSHGRLRLNHVHPCLHPIYFAQYPVLTSWFHSQAVNIHSSTIGSFSSPAVTIFGRRTVKERATLQVCWLMLKNIEPSMRSPRHSLFCARHAPRFSSHPLTSSRAGHPCCPCTGCCHARAAAATSTLPSSSHPAIPRKQTSTSSSAQKFSPPAVNGSLRSARGCVLWC